MSSDLPAGPATPAPVVAPAISSEYRDWLLQIKSRFRCVQLKAAVAVNTALLQFHWELGADIVSKQPRFAWGAGFLNQLSADLMREFPQVKGFSKRQLELIRQWHLFWRDAVVAPLGADNTAKQPVSQILAIPWGICKSKDRLVAEYALSDIHKPMGLSTYTLARALPDTLRGQLPSIAQIEREIGTATGCGDSVDIGDGV